MNMKGTPSWICSIYTTNGEKSWSEKFLLLFLCLITSFILSTFLLLGLRFPLNYGIEIFVSIASVLCLCVMVVMWFSPNVRCFGILFLMSISLKQGKKQLLAVGTTVVIVLNIQNTLMNLRGLGKSLVCNLEEKLLSIDLAPLSSYIRLLQWVASELKNSMIHILSGSLGGSYHTNFKINPKVHSGDFMEKLSEAHVTINKTAERVMVVVNDISSVGKQIYPVLGLVILVVVTVCYIRKFRFSSKPKNVFLTKMFLKYDEDQRLQGKPSVLPLTKNESKRYIIIPSAHLTHKDLSSMLKFSISIVSHGIVWLFFVGLDALVYWIIVVLRRRLEELKPLHVPVLLQIQKELFVIGIPVEHGNGVYDFSYNVPIFEKKCLPEPELWLYKSVLPLSVILGLLLLLVLLSSKLSQLRLIVSEHFYTEDAEKRIAKLHAKILKQRSKWTADHVKQTLKSFVTQLHFWCPIIFRNRNSDE
ncbi:Dendritic cell-specific transmembrane protein [Bagarius yarrelli]|uniref:Dendritic cell-specific transmembrane protein n=1 Tax=Bagarius yarrelli TaxID=175774 RepID=A0A556TM17_BAGYA|nr:Dendritic cell-specific transmembrane protein [Bagarius yarrelli]